MLPTTGGNQYLWIRCNLPEASLRKPYTFDSVTQPQPQAFITLNSRGVGNQRVDIVLDIEEVPQSASARPMPASG